jgi:hypothetical protein
MYSSARQQIHGGRDSGPIQIIGVYVGWRGRSLPGLLDYVTFWGRKSSAERVGDSDFQEFMIRLKNAYEDHAAPPAQPAPPTDPKLFGLITIGHSFGGQAVLRATSSFLEHRLADSNRSGRGYLHVPPQPGSGVPLAQPLQGFGDLVVLVNPAVEAAAYQRIHSLSQQLTYGTDQTPVLLTLSAENDVPRDRFFRLGRIAGEWLTGKPRKADPRERRMERQALGFNAEQVTHRLAPADEASKLHATTLHSTPDPGCKGSDHCDFEWYEWSNAATLTAPPDSVSADANARDLAAVAKITLHDYSSCTVLGGVELCPEAGAIPNQAFIVATVDRQLIDGHNGIFSGPLMRFLTRYIGLVEAKKFLPRVASGAPSQQSEKQGADR